MPHVPDILEIDFDKEVLQADLPVLVDFYASWCGPCRMIAPVLEKLAAEFAGRVKFVKVNVDNAPELALQYGVQAVPTLILLRGRIVVDEFVGIPDLRTLHQRLEAVSAAAPTNPLATSSEP